MRVYNNWKYVSFQDDSDWQLQKEQLLQQIQQLQQQKLSSAQVSSSSRLFLKKNSEHLL